MIRLLYDLDIKPYTTFGISATVNTFFEFTESDDLLEFINQKGPIPKERLVIGGGSNLLFTNNFNGLVLYPNIPGIFLHEEDAQYAYVEAGAGVNWDDFVDYCVKMGWGGLENLSLIPGNVGASPVQNIGAYGVEAKDHIALVRTVNLESGERLEFDAIACQFGYRDSIFKNELKNKVVVTSVLFRLNRFPKFKLDYGSVNEEVEHLGGATLANIRKAIVSIRESKLPDPFEVGNAGSFFKNPIVPAELAADMIKKYPNAPVYDMEDPKFKKLAAGWLIDQCGWKGFREKDIGVHPKQALVLVNYGMASGKDIYNLAQSIQNSVKTKFNVELEPEVNIIS